MNQKFNDIFKTKKVLIVDDEEMLREILKEEFEDYDMEVTTAMNGEAAFEILKSIAFDFIICDMKMPNGSGEWLLNKLQENDIKFNNFFLCTGFSTIPLHELETLGVTAVIKKPFEFESMLDTVSENL
jgi:DNA-binding NtrC family response regulator